MVGSATDRLAAARHAWLQGLREIHRRDPSAANTFALAQGCWRLGEYTESLRRFVTARDLAPSEPATHIATVRAAASLGHAVVESDALAYGLDLHPTDPDLHLHAALGQLPGNPTAAGHHLRIAAAAGPLGVLYQRALDGLAADSFANPPIVTEPALLARWEGTIWALANDARMPAFHGLPVSVLRAALAAAPATGLTLECGVYYGRSINLIAAGTPDIVHGFDSFQGLPAAWNADEPAGAYSTNGQLPRVAANVRLHVGWFEETLPVFLARHQGPIRLLHVDCDLYSSTRTVLEAVEPRLREGSVLVFDDFLGYPGYEEHEFRAWHEFAHARGLQWELLAVCLLGREVAIRLQ